MKKVINFFKCIGISYIYLFLFIIMQTLSLMGVMYYKLFTDFDFVEAFLEKFEPLYDNFSTMTDYFQNYSEIMTAYMEILQEILIPVLTVANICIILIIGTKILIDYKRKKVKVIKKIDPKVLFKYIGFGILLNLVISLIIGLLPKSLIESHSQATAFALNGAPLLLFLTSGILAPVAEELIFRYGMMKNLIKINVPFGIIVQALFFGLMHGNLVQSTYAFILGLIFGYVDYKNDNILYSIILHIAVNSSSVLISVLNINEFIGLLVLSVVSFIIFALIPKDKKA